MQQKPTLPEYPKWFTVFFWIYLGILVSAKYIFEIKPESQSLIYSMLAFALILSIFFASRGYIRDLNKYEILFLCWQISNLEGWIRYHEKDLKDGQPWFDRQDPSEWEFDNKYSIRSCQETLDELKQKLEEKMQK